MNKKRMLLASLLLMVVASVNAQSLWDKAKDLFSGSKTLVASENIVTKTIDLNAFDVLSKSGSIDAIYIQEEGTSNPRVVITGPDNIVEVVVVEQSGSTVKLHYKSNTNIQLNKKPFKVEVYSSEISKFSSSGSGDLDFGDIRVADLSISLTGSGDVEGKSVRSTGDVSVSLTGSGDVDLDGVQCFVLNVSVAGSGDVEVKGINSESVDARILGSGDIQLVGNTKNASYKVTGSGDIGARGLKAESVETSKVGSGDINY